MRKFRSYPGDPAYEREANEVARGFAPPIVACVRCGHPRISGYCCSCGCGCGESKDECTCEE